MKNYISQSFFTSIKFNSVFHLQSMLQK